MICVHQIPYIHQNKYDISYNEIVLDSVVFLYFCSVIFHAFVLDSAVFLNFCIVILWFGQHLHFGYIDILAVIGLDDTALVFGLLGF